MGLVPVGLIFVGLVSEGSSNFGVMGLVSEGSSLGFMFLVSEGSSFGALGLVSVDESNFADFLFLVEGAISLVFAVEEKMFEHLQRK